VGLRWCSSQLSEVHPYNWPPLSEITEQAESNVAPRGERSRKQVIGQGAFGGRLCRSWVGAVDSLGPFLNKCLVALEVDRCFCLAT
jgi:hypothetical protein